MSSVIVGAAGRRYRRHRSPAEPPGTVLDKRTDDGFVVVAVRDTGAAASYLDTHASRKVATTTVATA